MARHWIKEGDVPRVMIPTAMFPGLVLGLPAARVYAALAMRADNTSGLVDSTLEQIAGDAALSLTQVKAGVRLLLDNGWVEKVRQGNSRVSNKYRMHAAPVAVNRSETRPVNRAESRPVKQPEIRPVQDAGLAGNPTWTSRKSDHPLVSPSSCLSKDLSGEPDAEAGMLLHVAPTSTKKDASKPRAPVGYTADFEAFWGVYPKRDGKREGKAQAALEFPKAVKLIGLPAIMAAVGIYTASGVEKPPDAVRWLKHRRWEDLEPAGPRHRPTVEQLRATANAAEAARLLRLPWLDPGQPPSDPTPRAEFVRAARLDFIDQHADELTAIFMKDAS